MTEEERQWWQRLARLRGRQYRDQAAVFSDWLLEQGRDALANAIRRFVAAGYWPDGASYEGCRARWFNDRGYGKVSRHHQPGHYLPEDVWSALKAHPCTERFSYVRCFLTKADAVRAACEAMAEVGEGVTA